MRIALTSNLRTSDSEEQAEFDSQETVDYILGVLKELGHDTKFIELSRDVLDVVSEIREYKPDLIFNTGEGVKGKYREAFWPGIFDELGVPYTGSDPRTLLISLDKNLTKLIVSQNNVATPKSIMAYPGERIPEYNFNFPVIVKPNFEGSSKGITQNSIISSQEKLKSFLPKVLMKYDDGVLVEEYIKGKDITVPYLEGMDDPILDPIEYIIDEQIAKTRKYQIYDYGLKNEFFDKISFQLADISGEAKQKAKEAARRVVASLECKDLGRIDFRLTPEDNIYFLEINCLPYLDENVSFYLAAKNRGLGPTDVFRHIIDNALKRR